MADRDLLIRKALRLEYATVAWNFLEAFASVAAGIMAHSIALVGFGLDSAIEIVAAATLIWRLKIHDFGSYEEESDAEKKALFVIGITFFLLAAYVAFEAAKALWLKETPRQSWIGIGVTLSAAVIMPVLGFTKRRVAAELGSNALATDSIESMVCAYLSVIVLLGLALNILFGLWWADPVAGLVMVGFILKEGWEAVEESRE